jgi:hypothetical protein
LLPRLLHCHALCPSDLLFLAVQQDFQKDFMFEFYFVEIGILACTKVYLQIGTRVFDVKWYDCPKTFMCNKKMLPFMKVLGKKNQLLL